MSFDEAFGDLPGFHFEVKAVERLNVNDAMAQAVGDAGGKVPVVAHKRNRGEWLVTMRAADWFVMLASGHGALGTNTDQPVAVQQAS
jgi:hypothetical protein